MIEYRPATSDDLDGISETTREGFESYAAFQPRGWTPPPARLEAARVADRLDDPAAWLHVALEDGEVVAHGGFTQARTHDEARAEVEGMAHLFALFVRRPWWGSGIADVLHRGAVEEAGRRGYELMRLLTPAGQARARTFYEHRGWRTDGVAAYEEGLAMDLVTYFRDLP
ncbi:MAG: hypothetical protein QOE28_379 [Solirubrobacteraceae bacterium]|nr:hypothetical protein [Solirubrobacteraceae bacterium]